jgi:coniferyl-aldehyde dehydrogenase
MTAQKRLETTPPGAAVSELSSTTKNPAGDPGALLQRQRDAFSREGVVEWGTRVDRIDRCIALLVDHQQKIVQAINADFGNRSRHVSLMVDIFTSVATLKNAKKNVKKWMKPERRKAPVPLNFFGAKALIHYQPKGVIGLMTPWNVPVNMIFSPLADILAAGNRCIIKPSEYTPATGELMKDLFARYFDDTEISVVTGGADVGAAFSALPFDHLIFTGATSVGRLVMMAAAKNLTPVTLELGGKSPVIIGDSADLDDTAGKLMAGKTMNAGQLCICPDYALVPHSRLEALLLRCREAAEKMFPTIKNNPDYVSLINERHYHRIKSYVDDARARGARIIELNPAGEDFSDASAHRLPTYIIVNPDDDSLVMQDEIFGPILAVKTYQHVDEAIRYVNARPRPLALYYFGRDKLEQQRVVEETTSGGVTVNDVMMHFSCDDIPFGGVGPSGMGNYHGFEGFKTFSHSKAVLKQGFVNLGKLAGTLPPYGTNVDKMMAAQIKK